MLPAELDGEALSVALVDGFQAVESGELPVDTLIRLHLASGTGISEDGVCLIRFAYGDAHGARGTLWNLEGDFICGEDDTSSECQVDRYLGGFTELSMPGAKVKSSRPKVAGQRVTILKLPERRTCSRSASARICRSVSLSSPGSPTRSPPSRTARRQRGSCRCCRMPSTAR